MNYRWLSDDSGLWILVRTRPGNMIDRAPAGVAFEVDGFDLEHHRGWSVLVHGVLHHLDHNEVELVATRFDPSPWPHDDRTSWIAVKPRSISGRRLQAAGHEWPFPSEAYL